MTERFSRRSLVRALGTGRWGAAAVAAGVALGSASPASAINRSWDDAGGSASKLWSDFGNWSPDGNPSGDDLFIGNFGSAQNDTTLLDQSYTISSLTLTNGADVVTSSDNGATNDFQLTVTGTTSITGSGTTFFVIGADGDGLDTEVLNINAGGTLNLNSTTAQGTAVTNIRTVGGRLNNNTGGTIIGTGRIDFDANQAVATTVFTNNGTITANTTPALIFGAPAAGTLRINDLNDPEARFDWDGTAPVNAVINVNGNQTLDVDMSTGGDAWSGEMNLFTGSTLDMRDTWSMDSGTINVNTAAFGLIIIGQDPNPGAAATIAGANWTMSGGTINIEDSWDSLELDSQLVASGGTINNEGHLIFNGGATIQSGVDFNMTGSGARLTVNGQAVNIDTPDFNLDGNGINGSNVTTITNGGILDLDLGAGADENFDHDIVFNGGGELDVTTADNDWGINTSGTITAQGGGTANVNGEALDLFGDVTVTGNTRLNVNAVTTTNASTSFAIAAGSSVNMGNVTYNGGTYTGDGTLFAGTKTISAPTTFNVAVLDLDDGNSVINANLTINADQIDSSGDGIDGTHTIANDAVLTVNISGGGSYRLDNTLTYDGDASENTFLAGSRMTTLSTSTININGDGASAAVLDLAGTVNINTASDGFRLAGGNTTPGQTNTISGGTINGPGELRALTGTALRGNGTINAPIDFDGTSQLIAEGGTLTVAGNIIDVGTIGTVTGGTLNVTSAWNTAPALTVRLDGGTISGATITNDELSGIEGEGLVTARVINNTILEADSGGELLFNNTISDWDGVGNTGELRATGAGSVLRLDDSSTFLFNGTVTAQVGGTVFADTFELEFDPGSTLNLLSGGTYRSTNATDIGGTVVVSGVPSTMNISGTTVFENGSNTTLNGDLQLDNTVTNIESGATFSGAGRLFNANGRTTRLLNNADVGVLLQNLGDLELGTGATAARGDVQDYVQTASGSTNIDIGGTGIGQFDRLFVSGNAQLAGDIDLSLIGGYVPNLLDQVTVINASGGLIGTFDTVTGVIYAPGRALAVTYDANSVFVTATLPGDTDLDGDVDDTDLGTSFANYTGPGGSGKGWADGDFDGDGDVDDSDLGSAFSGYTGPLGPAAVPEPTSLALVGLGGLMLARRRRPA
ncbi:MAG: PEP-CTERM sorting domain-containing protein [Phycisphaeraceae bacterium]